MRRQRHLAIVARVMGPVLGASLLLASAGAVSAADPPPVYQFDPAFCVVLDPDFNEVASVPAGSDLVIFQGWITKTRGQLQAFINNVTWVLTVNQQKVTSEFFGPIKLGGGARWGEFIQYDAGIVGAGTILTHYDNILKSAHYDGFAHYHKGSVYGGGVDCTVTVTP